MRTKRLAKEGNKPLYEVQHLKTCSVIQFLILYQDWLCAGFAKITQQNILQKENKSLILGATMLKRVYSQTTNA